MNDDTPTALILALIAWSTLSLTALITGYVVTVEAGNWMLLIAEAILPPLAAVHGLGHLVGFWL